MTRPSNSTLEPCSTARLEEAGFISAYDRNAIRRTLGVQPPERLDERGPRNCGEAGTGPGLAGSRARTQWLHRLGQGDTSRDRQCHREATEDPRPWRNRCSVRRRGSDDQFAEALGDDTSESDRRCLPWPDAVGHFSRRRPRVRCGGQGSVASEAGSTRRSAAVLEAVERSIPIRPGV